MNGQQDYHAVAVLGFIVALAAVLLAGGAGPAYRWQVLDLRAAFTILEWGAWTGIAAALLCLLGMWLARPGNPRRGFALSLVGLIGGGLAFGVPFALLARAKELPSIHDISTDTEHPPAFLSVLPLRKGSSNPPQYGGPAVARQQQSAFPDIKPARLDVPPNQAFDRALQAARDLGWHLVAIVPSEGRIEATDTTAWFGFKDDVVIRVVPNGEGSRIDVRSESRIGDGDLGKNAQRVRKFLARVGS